MKHLSSIVLAVALIAAGATACFKDPTSSLRNGPNRIELSRSSLFVNVGDSISVQAEVKDAAGNTFDAADAVWTSSVPAIIAVNKAAVTVPFDAFSRAFVKALAPGLSWVFITTRGLTDSVQVYGLPLTFNGTVTHATSSMRDTITIAASATLGFTASGADSSAVTVGGKQVWMISRSASQLKFLAPPGSAGAKVHITNVMLLGIVKVPGLDATTTVTVTDPTEPANDNPATAPTLTLYQDYYGSLTSSDADDFVKFTTTTGDSVRIEILWQTDADLDGYLLDGTGGGYGVLDGYAMAGSADPETVTRRLAAATTYQLDINAYAAGSMTPVIYRIRTIKLQ
jgi:hypothetical protein